MNIENSPSVFLAPIIKRQIRQIDTDRTLLIITFFRIVFYSLPLESLSIDFFLFAFLYRVCRAWIDLCFFDSFSYFICIVTIVGNCYLFIYRFSQRKVPVIIVQIDLSIYLSRPNFSFSPSFFIYLLSVT